jgi:hypothetical protein
MSVPGEEMILPDCPQEATKERDEASNVPVVEME